MATAAQTRHIRKIDLYRSLNAFFVAQIISATSMLQVALGLLVQEKRLIEYFHEYGVTLHTRKCEDLRYRQRQLKKQVKMALKQI